MTDYDPVRRVENTCENPVLDDQGATGEYDPAGACKYQDVTILQLEAQLVKIAVDDFYRYFEEKVIKTGPIDDNNIELINEKLKIKGALSTS